MFLYPAAEPEDFISPVPATVVFPEDGTSSTVCSNFIIQTDTELEGDHDFTVAIMDISPGSPHAMIDAASSTTTVIITDDESKWNTEHALVVYCCGAHSMCARIHVLTSSLC